MPVPLSSLESQGGLSALLLELNCAGQYAIPQAAVYRIEDFTGQTINYSGGSPVIPYRNQVLKLIDLEKHLGKKTESQDPLHGARSLSVVVIEREQKLFGLIVKSILDIAVLHAVSKDLADQRLGIQGHCIHQDKTVVLLDVEAIVQSEDRFRAQAFGAASRIAS